MWPVSADSDAKAAPEFMSRRLLPVVFTILCAAVGPQAVNGRVCNVSDAYDLSSGIAADCGTLELQNSVTLTATSFSASNLVVNSQNLTIRSNAAGSEVILDFGSYTLNSKVLITGVSKVTLQDITLLNYASTTVQNGTLNTFLPLFNVDSTAEMYVNNVRFLVDTERCSLDPNYANELMTPRTSW